MQDEASPAVLLEGDGIAAVCVARLLNDAGVRYLWQPNTRPKLAAILIGEQTQHLLRELFPPSEQSPADLFDGFVQIKRRIVQWGSAAVPVELPHSGVVAPEAELLQRLWDRVPPRETFDGSSQEQDAWLIQSSRAGSSSQSEQEFGRREARFALVELHAGLAPDACWVESVAQGWLFLLALGEGKATLIAVGDTTESLLSASQLVANQIARIMAHKEPVPAYPRLTNVLAGTDVITCGSAAMSFDPLCGEGAGNAVREAFLAAAVVRASLGGHSRERLAEHYADRLRRGFLRHLQICLQFYTTGGAGDFWQTESALLHTGIQELERMVEHEPEVRFRLVNRDLSPV
jgi:hypothetical protein